MTFANRHSDRLFSMLPPAAALHPRSNLPRHLTERQASYLGLCSLLPRHSDWNHKTHHSAQVLFWTGIPVSQITRAIHPSISPRSLMEISPAPRTWRTGHHSEQSTCRSMDNSSAPTLCGSSLGLQLLQGVVRHVCCPPLFPSCPAVLTITFSHVNYNSCQWPR